MANRIGLTKNDNRRYSTLIPGNIFGWITDNKASKMILDIRTGQGQYSYVDLRSGRVHPADPASGVFILKEDESIELIVE